MIDTTKINEIKINDFDIKNDPTLFSELEKDVSIFNLLAIGESHGVKENADVYYYLFHKFSFDTIALEYPTTIENDINKFVKEGVLPKSISKYQIGDGRINLEYLALIKKLWDEKVLKNIICFDTTKTTETWNDRDEIYAKNFLEKFSPSNKTLLIAGNWHTKKTKFSSEHEEGELIPMCYILKNKIGDFPECKIIYHSGSLYNFEIKELDNGHVEENYLEKIDGSNYLLHVKKASPITLW